MTGGPGPFEGDEYTCPTCHIVYIYSYNNIHPHGSNLLLASGTPEFRDEANWFYFY
jgi:hypothetical protein